MRVIFVKAPHDAAGADTATLYVVLPQTSGPLPAAHREACHAAAMLHGAWLASAPYEADGKVWTALFGPGEEAHYQAACFLPPALAGREKGTTVHVFSTPFGRLALAGGLDILQPQYTRLAALKGCQLLVATLWATGEELMMAGAWSAAQANGIAVAAAQPQGGQLILPCALTEDNSGLGRDEFEPAGLAAAYNEFPVFDSLNPALYRRYRKELLC